LILNGSAHDRFFSFSISYPFHIEDWMKVHENQRRNNTRVHPIQLSPFLILTPLSFILS